MSNVEFQEFVRKQFPVQAVRVTPLNMVELSKECDGKIMHDGDKEGQFSRDYIKVNTHRPQDVRYTEAHVGDWLVRQGRSWKIYLDRPFRQSFDLKDGGPIPADNQPKGSKPNKGKGKRPVDRRGAGPSPANMPKRRVEGPRMEGVPEQGDKFVGQSHAGITSSQPIVLSKEESDHILDTHFGPKDSEHEDLSQQHPDEEVEIVFPRTMGEALEEGARKIAEEKQQSKKKSITLDELNARTE